jgi:hypothetical protein
MPKGKNTPAHTLVVLTESEMLPRVTLSKLKDAAVAQMAIISRSERETPIRAFLLGIMLHRIKPAMSGEFSKWIAGDLAAKTHWTPATAKKNASYYMRLAVEVIEQTNATKPELLALPENHETKLDEFDAAARKFVSRLEKFIDGRSLNELLRDLGIKDAGKIGGARELAAPAASAETDPEQLYLFARDEIGLVITQAETLLVKENRLQHLANHPEEVRGVVESLRTLADKVEAAAKPLLKQ